MKESPIVKMVGIHKWFNKVHALKSVDFTIGRNEIVALIGDNGAGKSTLIKILCGIYPPDKGEIYIRGEKVRFLTPKDAMKQGIEAVHQETMLVDTLDIKRNIFLGKELAHHFGFGPIKWLNLKKMERESIESLEQISLHLKSASIKTDELSGGQRQGVVIARAVYFKTKILILDEPTNNLSIKEARKVLQLIQDLPKHGISSVFITHNLYHAYPIADRFIILRTGEVVGNFTKENTSLEELIDIIIR